MNRIDKPRLIPIEKSKITNLKNQNFIIYGADGTRLSGTKNTSYKVITLLYTLCEGVIDNLTEIYVYDTRKKININSLEFIDMYSLKDSRFINKGVHKVEQEHAKLSSIKKKNKKRIYFLKKESKTHTDEYVKLMLENYGLKVSIKSHREHLIKMYDRLRFIKEVVAKYRKENVV